MKGLRAVTLAAGTAIMLLGGCAGAQPPLQGAQATSSSEGFPASPVAGAERGGGSPTASTAPSTSGAPAGGAAGSSSGTGSGSSSDSGSGGGGRPAACHARQLVGENRGTGGAAGSIGLTVALRNVGARACTLRGRPGVVLLRDGAELPTYTDAAPRPKALTLNPGRAATFYVIWTNPEMEESDQFACQPASTHIRITPPGQEGTLTIRAAVNTCHGRIRVTQPEL
jgi:hypothetical protein